MIKLLIILFCSTISVQAQEIDCSHWQSQVNDFTTEIANAQTGLQKAQDNLNKCLSIDEVVNSEDFKALKDARKNGVNWNEIR